MTLPDEVRAAETASLLRHARPLGAAVCVCQHSRPGLLSLAACHPGRSLAHGQSRRRLTTSHDQVLARQHNKHDMPPVLSLGPDRPSTRSLETVVVVRCVIAMLATLTRLGH